MKETALPSHWRGCEVLEELPEVPEAPRTREQIEADEDYAAYQAWCALPYAERCRDMLNDDPEPDSLFPGLGGWSIAHDH